MADTNGSGQFGVYFCGQLLAKAIACANGSDRFMGGERLRCFESNSRAITFSIILTGRHARSEYMI